MKNEKKKSPNTNLVVRRGLLLFNFLTNFQAEVSETFVEFFCSSSTLSSNSLGAGRTKRRKRKREKKKCEQVGRKEDLPPGNGL
jgi:hypothetical protein